MTMGKHWTHHSKEYPPPW